MKESGRGGVLEQVRLHLGAKPDLLLFRNQAGFVEANPGCSVCGAQRREAQRYGLARGASDLIGILSMPPTANGMFFALEVKAPGKKPDPDQIAFMALVKRFGGLAGWCDSVKSAEIFYLECGGRH